ncbi:hypothetical protein EV199_0595 [Pseudobacter ginsenosidimutans]|uniref:Uncharacterized protein n=1 Tax=Pseudobacter ginsenosidimutans TaxID=661488 RepID=A0A4Q7N249_9BACT|nr:hypothetical protein EV199_0595 [Pseudobacter ginsenosidimutans]
MRIKAAWINILYYHKLKCDSKKIGCAKDVHKMFFKTGDIFCIRGFYLDVIYLN